MTTYEDQAREHEAYCRGDEALSLGHAHILPVELRRHGSLGAVPVMHVDRRALAVMRAELVAHAELQRILLLVEGHKHVAGAREAVLRVAAGRVRARCLLAARVAAGRLRLSITIKVPD